ncbi:PLP-dependent aminotransferase family protein [Pantoea sp. 18069]|uniref:MocR-like pyridoxine biosynthesis transcription factor PdxR n=1 Tax=Pantoea sp. 18069 TaxID=2681415 RepID=UPI001356FA7F|nr:PLP-dependent aminotransferase family protein [Pantoea sp. 18069]
MSQLKAKADRRRGANGGGRRVYALLRAQIADGSLAVGAKLPSTRALAADLGVARSTVTVAYEQLAAEGFLATAPGRAARVAAPLAPDALAQAQPGSQPRLASVLSAYGQRVAGMELLTAQTSAAAPARIDFLYGAVAARDFPTLAWKRAYQAELLRQQPSLYYAAPEGDSGLRQALQGYLRRARGLACSAEQIVIVQGAQQAIDLCARLLLEPGSAYVFEDPGYVMARRCFEASGARGVAVPVDALGMDTSSLPFDAQVRLAYVTPSHQFPLGGVLPIARRQALLQWARQHNAWIVEDDYDGEFRYGQRPIDALQSIDADGRVIYIGTFSKALSPQLRLAYLVLPASLVPLFRKAKRLADRHAPVIEQRALASLIDSGAYERHVRRMRRENERRRSALLDAIRRRLPADAKVAGTAAGLHLVLWLPSLRPGHEPQLIAAARAAGVGVYAVSPLFARPQSAMPPRPAGLILGYASLTLAQIDEGMQRLADAIAALA